MKAPAPPRIDEAANVFKMLAEPVRLRILTKLRAGEMTVGALVAALGLPQPTVSHHLALLRAARMVRVRREGKFRLYALVRPVRSRDDAITPAMVAFAHLYALACGEA